jgi:chromosome segregation ATPase
MRAEAIRQDELGDLARQIASQLKPDGAARSENVLRPSFQRQSAQPATRPEQVAALNAIVKAADLIGARQEQLQATERRATEAEEQVVALRRQINDLEMKLRTALDLAQRERKRAEDLEQRSAEMLDRTQAMLTDASEQLAASEKRANQAEDYLANLQSLIRDRLEA